MFSELIADLLKDGFKVSFAAPGHSMFPTIMANETILVEPIEPSAVSKGDIVLYRSNGDLVAHRVMGIVTDARAIEYSNLLNVSWPEEEQRSTEKVNKDDGPSPPVGDPQIALRNRLSESAGLKAGRTLLKFCDQRNAPHGLQSRSSNEEFFFIFCGDACLNFDEPVASDQVLGKVVSLERKGHSINPYSHKHKLACWVHVWTSRLKRLLS